MTDYNITTEKSPERDAFADTEPFGGAITLYLPEFKNIHPQLFAWGDVNDDIIFSVLKAVLIHEDLHSSIQDAVDTNGNQEHDSVYIWIQQWMNEDINE